MSKSIVCVSLIFLSWGAVGQAVADDEVNPIFHYVRSDSVFYMAQATTGSTQQDQTADIAGEGEKGDEQADVENIGSQLAVPATVAAAIIFSILVSGL